MRNCVERKVKTGGFVQGQRLADTRDRVRWTDDSDECDYADFLALFVAVRVSPARSRPLRCYSRCDTPGWRCHM